MTHYRQVLNLYGLGSASLFLGIAGALFFWWVPTGMVLSLMGLVIGVVGIVLRGKSTALTRLLASGIVVSILALILDCIVAAYGFEAIRFHALG
jgi:hypothetical protein